MFGMDSTGVLKSSSSLAPACTLMGKDRKICIAKHQGRDIFLEFWQASAGI